MLENKDLCCGCSACLHVCPKHSITFEENREGFSYPKVNLRTCIECGLCEKVCPILSQNTARVPFQIYAAKHRDNEVRLNSSSGGVFTLLAENILRDGGVVFGARFNEKWEVIHDFTESKDSLAPFRGSKYVQSNIGNTYTIAERFLKSGRQVMFTGTPCQISGLKKYLRKDYDNLLTVDFVCHGVPSPMVWRKYLEDILFQSKAKKRTVFPSDSVDSTLTSVNFRDKSTGWKKYSVTFGFSKDLPDGIKKTMLSSVYTEDSYMTAFLSNLSLRPSCYSCQVKASRSGADITIGDFWGSERIESDFDDDIGVSVVFINNLDASKYLLNTDFIYKEVNYDQAIDMNKAMVSSSPVHPMRGLFMDTIRLLGFRKSFFLSTNSNFFIRILRRLYRTI